MRTLLIGMVLLIGSAGAVSAGCIGPVIMGKCEGTSVPWDTHAPAQQHPNPPPGFYYDWRGTQEEPKHHDINPFTGRDANDSHWGNLDEDEEE